MNVLTHTRLLEVLRYDPTTGVFTWIKNVGAKACGSKAGARMCHGYEAIRIDKRLYTSHRLAWFYVHKTWPEGLLDHRNRVRHDNRISNLREATPTQNSRNRGGVKGVSWCNTYGKWIASIGVNYKRKALGAFDTKEEAEKARAAAETALGWGQ